MGVFYSSICLPGNRRDEASAAIGRWLGSRGFVPIDRPALFDLDAASERAAFVISLANWTVVLFSDFEEERRLVHALQAVPTPSVYLWVYDSETWGFDIFAEGGYAGSFSSDPHDHQSFDDEPMGTPERPPACPEAVCERLGAAGRSTELGTLMTQRAVFKEEVARAFCDLIGAHGALASYDELEAGTYDAAGATVDQLLYVRSDRLRGRPPADLHAQRITQRHPTGGGLETGTIEIPAELWRELARSKKRMRLRLMLLRPVSLMARAWRIVLEQVGRRMLPPTPGRLEATYRVDGRDLINERHGCRLTLTDRMAPATTARKPSAVFGFTVEAVTVACQARRLDALREVVRRPDRAEVATDERYHVGPYPARWLRFRLPPGFHRPSRGASILGLHIIQTAQALYVFLYRVGDTGQPRAEARIRRVVESFRVLAEPEPAQSRR